VIGQRHYDVQLMGGAALHFGWVAEMKTGEGKTLVSTLPVYLNALTGKGVHLVTVNDYLARFATPSGWADPPWLGLTSAWSSPASSDGRPQAGAVRRRHHLRHQQRVRLRLPARQHGHVAGRQGPAGPQLRIVDEVDSILIDEARTPLIISAGLADAAKLYYKFASIVRGLKRDVDYEVDEEKRTVAPTESGIEKVERALGIENLYDAGVAEPRAPAPGGAEGQGAVQARQGLHRPGRRGEDRRRVHRPHPRGPALVRGPPPGGRGQGGREDQGGEPDPRHDHPPELLPHVRQARRHDRHGPDRGRRADEHLQAAGGAHPHQPPMVRLDEPTSSTRARTASSPPWSTTSSSATPRASRCWSAPSRSRSPRSCRACSTQAGHPHEVLNAKQHTREAEIVAQAGRLGGGHRGHQHGRSRRRHPARRQPRGLAEAPRRALGRGPRAPPARDPRARPATRSCSPSTRPSARPRATRSASSAGSTCSAPSATRAAASTTSSAAAPAARATRARAASTCRSRTSSCASSPPAP
jgi:preprotein translocase subunit SecA